MDSFISQIKDRWFIWAFIASMILWYANTNYKINALAASDTEQSAQIQQLQAMQTDVAVTRAKVDFLYDKFNK